MRKYMYSVPFLIMSVGFAGLIKQHWAAVVPMVICIMFAVENYASMDDRGRVL